MESWVVLDIEIYERVENGVVCGGVVVVKVGLKSGNSFFGG